MPQHDLKLAASSNSDIVTPGSGYRSLYFNNSGYPAWRDSGGTDHAFTTPSTWYDVTQNGLVGDASTDNSSAWTALYAALPVNATVYFPAGTYNTSAEFALTGNKQLRILGCGDQRSLIQKTTNSINIFNCSGAGAYNSFENLGFRSSVTATAGAAIFLNNNVAYGGDILNCSFTGQFYGIYCLGSLAGNTSVFDNLNMSSPVVNGRGIKIDGSNINLVIAKSTFNFGSGAGAISGSACIEINQCGAIQLVGNDIIGGVNALLINATNLVSAVLCDNDFFDQSGGSTVKIAGTSNSSRIKFVECGITAGTASTHALEINGTGSGGAGSATALPAGIAVIGCDIYSAQASTTSSGILVNGCQDFTVLNNQITGFAGAGGCGIQITPSTANTRFVIANNVIGPNENWTTGNTTGILINAGSGPVSSSVIVDNNLAGNTTAITDNSTIATATQKYITSNVGAMLNGGTATVSAAATFTADAVIAALTTPIPAGGLLIGSKIRVKAVVVSSAISTTMTLRARWGTAGTTGDAAAVTAAIAGNATLATQVTTYEAFIVVRSLGVSGSVAGSWTAVQMGTTNPGTPTFGASASQTVTTVNTTVANLFTISLQASTGTGTVLSATVEVVKS